MKLQLERDHWSRHISAGCIVVLDDARRPLVVLNVIPLPLGRSMR